MKKYAAIGAAFLMLLSSAGCTAVSRYDVAQEDQAYSRNLYPEGDVPVEEDDYDEFEYEYDEEFAEEKPEQPKEKTEEKKTESKEVKRNAVSKSNSSAASSSSASSSNTSSKKSKRTTYRQSDLKKNTSSKTSSKTTSSARVSTSDSDKTSTDTDTEKPQIKESPKGTFRESDLSYNARWDYLDFDDSEYFVRKIMGEPRSIEIGTDAAETKLVYKDCTVTMRMRPNGEFRLVDILIPRDSLYRTFKGLETEAKAERVIELYGEPTEIIAVYPDGYVPPEPSEDTDGGSGLENEENSDPDIADSDTEEISDTETDISEQPSEEPPAESSEPETPQVKPLYELYIYTIDDRSFILKIENGEVAEMEYRWDADF